ncbi:MAG: uroporphyrinogen-III C-methyltransferase [Candidatus Arsenophonus melophagi]|nr:uroporphyrinogen-III C-methyltransferase [Candidatus Arsenophonus melophagi]
MMEKNKLNDKHENQSTFSKKMQSTMSNDVSYKNKKNYSFFFGRKIVLILVIFCSGLCYYCNLQYQRIVHENRTLQQKVSELIHQKETEQQKINQLLESQDIIQLNAKEYAQQIMHKIENLQSQITELASVNVKSWLLATAEFLAKIADQKLWNDNDPKMALFLLQSASTSLVEMNDPNLMTIRKKINSDIDLISTISKIYHDEIILKLNQLSSNIDYLRINNTAKGYLPIDEDNIELSNNITDWKKNITKSLKKISANFISIHHRDFNEAHGVSSNQDSYRRSNIRAQLLIAAKAVPLYQQKIYKKSLEKAATLIKSYYNTNDMETKLFLNEVNKLIDKPIIIGIPKELKSLLLFDKPLQKSFRDKTVSVETETLQKNQPTNKNKINDDIK